MELHTLRLKTPMWFEIFSFVCILKFINLFCDCGLLNEKKINKFSYLKIYSSIIKEDKIELKNTSNYMKYRIINIYYLY